MTVRAFFTLALGAALGAVVSTLVVAASDLAVVKIRSFWSIAGIAIHAPDGMPVNPRGATSLPIIDVSDLLVTAIPAKGFEGMGWDYMAGSPFVLWRTDGIAEGENGTAYREGWMRVRVGGRPSTVLHSQREELAWTLKLSSNEPAKFGPKMIEIDVGTQPQNECFGSPYDGCNFSPKDIFASSSLQHEEVCRTGEFGEAQSVFAVSAPGKPKVLVVHATSGGSGGETSWIHILPMSAKGTVCRGSHVP